MVAGGYSGMVIYLLDDALTPSVLLLFQVDLVDTLGTCSNVDVYPAVPN